MPTGATEGSALEPPPMQSDIVLVEVFGGVLPFSLQAQQCKVGLVATYSFEVGLDANTVADTHFPHAINLGSVNAWHESLAREVLSRHPDAKWLVCGGPPCVDVSKLNKHRSGAGGPNSSLFV